MKLFTNIINITKIAIGAQSSGPGHFLRHCRDRLRRQPGRRRGSVRWIQLAHFTSACERRQWPSSWPSPATFASGRPPTRRVTRNGLGNDHFRTTNTLECFQDQDRRPPLPRPRPQSLEICTPGRDRN